MAQIATIQSSSTVGTPEGPPKTASRSHGVLAGRMTSSVFPAVDGRGLGAAANAIREHIETLAYELNLPLAARHYIRACIQDGPSRAVSGQMGNVCFDFHSTKMDARLKLESRRGEHVHAILLEDDPEVVAYFPQPPQVSLDIQKAGGIALTRANYSPDMLVIRRKEIVIAETRDETRLLRAMQRNPVQFFKDSEHKWHYAAAEKFYTGLGFRYELISNATLPAILVENIRFLEDYCSDDCPPLAKHLSDAVAERVRESRFLSLLALLDDGFTADAIFKCVAARVVYVDLYSERLASTSELILYSDIHTSNAHKALRAAKQEPVLPIPGTYVLKPGSRIKFNGSNYVVVLTSQRDVLVADEQGQQSTVDLQAILEGNKSGLIELDTLSRGDREISIADIPSVDWKRAQDKLDAVRSGNTDRFSTRSLSRFKERIAHAVNDLEALIALVDKTSSRGNRATRISQKNEGLIEKAISTFYNNPRNSQIKGVWDKYVGLCAEELEENGQPVRPVSYATFCLRANELASTNERKGKRAAYQESAIQQAIECVFPAHGVRPHEICYIDHTTANIALTSPSGNDLGKPTLSIAIDGHVAKPRALYISFDPPGTRVVLMILRDYVRRNGRLPRVISVDNGPDFRSKELSEFCKLYGIELRFRAPGQPRGGAMIERLIGATETEVLSELEGNTRILRTDTRLVTKSVDPFRRATWTLPALYGVLENYLFEELPNRPHPALGVTPNEYEARRTHETGAREFRGVHFDENIMLMTCPHARRPFHTVDQRRGVWVDGLWYQHPSLRSVKEGVKVEVRVEPWNARVVYVRLPSGWIAAIGRDSRWLYRSTRREFELSLRAERRQAQLDANRAKVNPAARKSRQKEWTPEQFDPRLAAMQEEMRYLYDQKQMTLAMPAAVPSEIETVRPVAGSLGNAPLAIDFNNASAADPIALCSPAVVPSADSHRDVQSVPFVPTEGDDARAAVEVSTASKEGGVANQIIKRIGRFK